MTDIIMIAVAYFIGTFPSAYLCGRLFKGLDIRQTGSGNVGAMNTMKHVGYLPGILTLVADVVKGALAVYLATLYGSWPLIPLLAAFFVVLGHNYNIFLGLKGGKGLGSLTGSMLVLSPITFLYILALVILIALLIRDTNTASGLGILTLPVILGLQKGELAFYLVGAAISLIVAVKHIRDFKAYLQGRRRLI